MLTAIAFPRHLPNVVYEQVTFKAHTVSPRP